MKKVFVSDLTTEQTITSFFLVSAKELRSTKEGKPYLRLELCDRSGTVEALTRMSGLYVVGLAPDEVFPREEIIKHGYQATPAGDLWEIGLADGQTIDPVVRLLHARGLNLRHLVEKRQTLEDQFVEVVKGNATH